MLALSEPFMRAGRSDVLTEPLQYAAQRLGEALDPSSHFARSAAFLLPPQTLLRELEELLSPFVAGASPPYASDVRRVAGWTRGVMRLVPRLNQYYGGSYAAMVQAARAVFVAPSDANVRHAAGTHLLPAVRALLSDLHSSPSYGDRLQDEVLKLALGPLPDLAAWSTFDRLLTFVAADALERGNHGPTLASSIAERLRDSESSEAAAAGLRVALNVATAPHAVALALDGVATLEQAPGPNLFSVGRGEGWPGDTTAPADESLRAYAARHIDQGRVVLVVLVAAKDAGQAHAAATARLRPVQDQIAVLHRAARPRVLEEALVLAQLSGELTYRAPRAAPVARAARLAAPADELLADVTHYAALATAEPVSAVATLHAFIALEKLAEGAEETTAGVPMGVARGKASFLPPHLGAITAMAFVHHVLLESWQFFHSVVLREASDGGKQLVEWAAPSGELSLTRWSDVLGSAPAQGPVPAVLIATASSSEAAVVWHQELAGMTSFARRRLQLDGRVWSRSGTLLQRAREQSVLAHAHTDRLRHMRNRTVHSALTAPEGADALAAIGRSLLATVFEVLPPWVSTTQQNWLSLHQLANELDQRRRTWKKQAVNPLQTIQP